MNLTDMASLSPGPNGLQRTTKLAASKVAGSIGYGRWKVPSFGLAIGASGMTAVVPEERRCGRVLE
jgi:hypothetical protein